MPVGDFIFCEPGASVSFVCPIGMEEGAEANYPGLNYRVNTSPGSTIILQIPQLVIRRAILTLAIPGRPDLVQGAVVQYVPTYGVTGALPFTGEYYARTGTVTNLWVDSATGLNYACSVEGIWEYPMFVAPDALRTS